MNKNKPIPTPRALMGLLLLSLFAACSPQAAEPEAAPARAERRTLPITMVEQEIFLAPARTWEIMVTALEQQDIPLEEVVEQELLIITSWIPMTDRLCTTETAGNVPLECETQYRLALIPLSQEKSLVRIRYVEDCTGEHEIFLTCPDSTAERRMMAIIGDIKALAGS